MAAVVVLALSGLAGCSVPPPVVLVPSSAVVIPSAPPGCKAALPPDQVPWSSQSADGIDGWWIGTVAGAPAEMRIFDAMMKADQGLPLVGLWICVAR